MNPAFALAQSALSSVGTLSPTSAWRMQLVPLQQARMHLAIAASASAAYQTLLHLKGPSTEDQAHARELVRHSGVLASEAMLHCRSLFLCTSLYDPLQARLVTYKEKVTKVESEKWLQEHRPTLSVDVAGANRFISAAIPELTSKQKHALRMVRSALLLRYCSWAALHIASWQGLSLP